MMLALALERKVSRARAVKPTRTVIPRALKRLGTAAGVEFYLELAVYLMTSEVFLQLVGVLLRGEVAVPAERADSKIGGLV
ncbi:hypothetical protein V6N11_053396 [Hibiscus sabdariffa]|uniref:Histone H2A n=1 Tax=Hibiscus sabdariffa TaxID=183260 RepID=A0ABR2UDK7_9ROSI